MARSAFTNRVFLPLAQDQLLRYGWKGTAGGDVASPDWFYTWRNIVTPMPGSTEDMSATSILAELEAGLQASAKYAPMVWCTSDVPNAAFPNQPFPTPQQIAELASRYPGRVWLMFNEPDYDSIDAGCGGYIAAANRKYKDWLLAKNWTEVGNYIADQYGLYYSAIKSADPTARVFSMAPYHLPMPTLNHLLAPGGIELWNVFLSKLQAKSQTVDGIAVHAYPRTDVTGHIPGCNNDMQADCTQEALLDAYRFFQGTDSVPSANRYPSLTSGKPMWLTETGILETAGAYVGEQPLSQQRVVNEYMLPMVQWLNAHSVVGGDASYINAVAWFVTYWDKTPYTNLLVASNSSELSVVGEAWRNAACPDCECPGPDCRLDGR